MQILLLLLLLILIILSIPSVQTKLGKYATQRLNDDFGVNIKIDRMGINWKGEVDIREVLIRDHHEDTLIYSQFLKTNILSIPKLINGNLDFGFIDLENARLYITTYKGEDNDNLSIFASAFDSGDTTKTSEPFKMWGSDVIIQDMRIRFMDENLESPVPLDLTELNLKAEDLFIKDSDVTADIEELRFLENRGLKVTHLSGKFSYGDTQIEVQDMDLQTPHSEIKAQLLMTYENGMGDFENQVYLDIDFEESILSTNDLNPFYNQFGPDIDLRLYGLFQGTLNDFQFRDAQLGYENTQLSGDFRFQNN